jgi:hypothetical protein
MLLRGGRGCDVLLALLDAFELLDAFRRWSSAHFAHIQFKRLPGARNASPAS